MATTMKTEVIIDDVDISSTRLVNWLIPETFGEEVRTCEISVSSNIFNDIPDLEVGKTITIKRGTTTSTDQFVFNGTVDRIERKEPNVKIVGKDLMATLVRKSVTKSYDGVSFPSTESKGSDIATDLIETEGGMTATVVDTGDVLILKQFICRGTDIFTRLKVLARIYDYQIYYNPEDSTVHFEPKGNTINTQNLIIGGSNTNVTNIPKWEEDAERLVNYLKVKGAVQEVQDEEFFDGDNSANQVFSLAEKPTTVQVWEDVAGTLTLKVPGVEGSTGIAFDYEINKENQTITATDNWTPASGSDNVKIVYSRSIPVPILVQDEASQDKYEFRSAEKYFTDIQTVNDAEQRGQSWIDKYKKPFISTMCKPATLNDYNAGQKVGVIDNLNDKDEELVITKITKKYPHNGDEIELGDEEWRLAEWGSFTLERIRRLEEEIQKNVDLLIEVKTFSHASVAFKRRYLDVISRTVTGNSMIWGHPVYGTWGTDKWGDKDTAFGAEVLLRRVWPEQKYIEKFIDTDFEGSGTGNWNITLKQLEL